MAFILFLQLKLEQPLDIHVKRMYNKYRKVKESITMMGND